MAATVSAWSKPGAWALDSEEHEEELQQQKQKEDATAAATAVVNNAISSDFPALAVAATTKTKKKKGQTFSLAEFTTGKPAPVSQPKRFTNEDLVNLPTGPRERTPEELDRNRIGGGFRSYGQNDRNGGGFNRGERGDKGGFGGDSSREFGPSRADENDNWGAAKKFGGFGGGGGFERRDRGERVGFFSDSQSRADESDNWGTNKSFVPNDGPRRFGSGGFERRGGGLESNGGAADSDNWGRKKEDDVRRFGGGGGSAFDSLRERRGPGLDNGGGVDSDTWGRKREDGVGNGGGGIVRPRLNLQPRSVPIVSGGQQQNGGTETVVVKPSKGSNPFGDARPREEVLKEKGQDWKEVDEKLESMKIRDVASPIGDVASPDGHSFGGRRGVGNGRASVPEERSWRKPVPAAESVDSRPQSAEKSENGHVEEAEDSDPQL